VETRGMGSSRKCNSNFNLIIINEECATLWGAGGAGGYAAAAAACACLRA
jgi:hypothetical protein